MAQPGTPTRPRLLLGLVWWMWIAIGAGFTVVVFLMILVICLCKRIKRKKVSKRKSSRESSYVTLGIQISWDDRGWVTEANNKNVM